MKTNRLLPDLSIKKIWDRLTKHDSDVNTLQENINELDTDLQNQIDELNSNMVLTQRGEITGVSVAPSSITDIEITFKKEFGSLPVVICGIRSATTSPNYGYLGCFVTNVTTTGCTLRVANPLSDVTFNPNVAYIATGSI